MSNDRRDLVDISDKGGLRMTGKRQDPDFYAQLALELSSGEDMFATLEKVLDFAASALGADYAGVLLRHSKDRLETAATTDPLVKELDQVQMDVGEGPDIALIRDLVAVTVTDTRHDERWPLWARQVSEAGIRSMLGVRIYTHEGTIGSLNVYARAAEAFDLEDQEVAHVLARHAGVALRSRLKIDNLDRALGSRKLVGIAQGILMERFKLDADQAFAVLLRYSQDRNVKLRVVAESLATTGRLPD